MTRTPSVLIVGAGFGGLAAALELKRHGHHEFTIIDKADGLGGVWRDNTYPGAACDAPSDLYSFSFEQNANWPKRFAGQADILAYMHDVAERNGLMDHIRFGIEVASADFDADSGVWRVQTSTGEVIEADVFVPAVGQLSRPVMPTIEGMASFRGASFHSAQWNHDVDLTEKRVAIVGTGASAIQIIPAIQPKVGSLTVFQRSAPWIIPKFENYYIPPKVAALTKLPVVNKLPGIHRAERLGWWAFYEFVTSGLEGNGKVADFLTAWATSHRESQIDDPELLAKMTPDYQAGCKRGLMASNYYPAVGQPNVHIETSHIEKITPNAVVTDDGVSHPVDVIVYCTGFAATQFLAPMNIHGIGGKSLREVWSDGARAYYGLAVPHFPNMFVMYGPNTNLGSGSIIYMHEQQARYVRQAVEFLKRKKAFYVAVKPEVEQSYDAEIQKRLEKTVWTKCSSWYREASGRVVANWPGKMSEYGKRTNFDPKDYDVTRQLAVG
ncbi:flavin-containing monooxygenase [Antrihabitans spumae]|jgi:cation diffusion facilitator CzcD-associated flavoprotein CzcO|uniref:Flavin-containing monooxygenase n=1 Tax=Antrihabitans spumae TaxID=3373370 RepID=A0ABW7K2M8_9NOCA